MQLSKKDITNMAGSRFDSKFIKSVWGWVLIIVVVACFIFYSAYDRDVKEYKSNSGDMIKYSSNYGNIIDQYVFDGNTITNYGEYITFNNVKYDSIGVDKYEVGNDFLGFIYSYRKYISITILVLFAALGYFKYYRPRNKYIKQLIDEYNDEQKKGLNNER